MWLRENVQSLREWEGARLQAVEQKDLPKYVRTIACIPDSPLEMEKILVRLARLNPGLKTAWWTVHERQDGDGKKDTHLISTQY